MSTILTARPGALVVSKPRGQSAHDCDLVPRGFFDHLGRDEQQHYDHVEDGQHYPLAWSQASALPSGFLQTRSHPRNPCLRLTLPLAGRVEDFHLQVWWRTVDSLESGFSNR